MLISHQPASPSPRNRNLLTLALASLHSEHEADRSISIIEVLKGIGRLRRTGNAHFTLMRRLTALPEATVDQAIARLHVPLMATVWNEVAHQSTRRKPVFECETPYDAVRAREDWERILWGLYAYEDERSDRPWFMEKREELESELERFDQKYRPILKTFPLDEEWRRQQRKMLTETDRRDWWWYE